MACREANNMRRDHHFFRAPTPKKRSKKRQSIKTEEIIEKGV